MKTNNKDTKVSSNDIQKDWFWSGECLMGAHTEFSSRHILELGRIKPTKKDAKLITAAPELLEATKWLLYYVKITSKHLASNAIEYAETAIKKATEQ